MNTPGLIYAIGDIHGSLAKLTTLIARCEQHAGGRTTTFVFLGDYIDRGPDSAGVIRTLMSLQSRPQTRVIALKGNHEALALEAVDGAVRPTLWLQQGGKKTLRSYNVRRARDLPNDHMNGCVRCRCATTTESGFSFTPGSTRKSRSTSKPNASFFGSGSRSYPMAATMAV